LIAGGLFSEIYNTLFPPLALPARSCSPEGLTKYFAKSAGRL